MLESVPELAVDVHRITKLVPATRDTTNVNSYRKVVINRPFPKISRVCSQRKRTRAAWFQNAADNVIT